MKKILLLSAFAGLGLMANAQKTIDIAVRMKSPADGQQIKLTNAFNLSYTLKNNGPDAISNGVEVTKIDISINGNVIPALVNQFKFNKDFPAGDSITFSINNLKINGLPAGNTTFCAEGSIVTTGVTDPDLTNNKSCSNVEFLDNAGISDEGFTLDFSKPSIYPNPTNGITNIAYNLNASSNISIAVFDVNGKLVTEILNERQIPGNYINYFDASVLNAGMYFITMKSDAFSASSRLVVTK